MQQSNNEIGTNKKINTIFFGSTKESVIVADKLLSSSIGQLVTLSFCCVVTQPPRPVGRHQDMTPTPVETWAKAHHISVLTFPTKKESPWLFEHEESVVDAIQPFKPDLLITASYGQKIPTVTIKGATFGGLNVHPSLLPRWRGADPVPWAIMNGDAQTGVTIISLAENFDEGKIIAQKKIPILPTDTTETLYPKLFTLGADLLTDILPRFLAPQEVALRGASQGPSPTPYARRLTKQDGFVEWNDIIAAMDGKNAVEIDRKFRALHPWPGLWTKITIQQHNKVTKTTKQREQQKRVRILKLHLSREKLIIDEVQIEGKLPTTFDQFSKVYLPS